MSRQALTQRTKAISWVRSPERQVCLNVRAAVSTVSSNFNMGIICQKKIQKARTNMNKALFDSYLLLYWELFGEISEVLFSEVLELSPF